MDVLAKLEQKFDELIRRTRQLEAENARIVKELEREREARKDVLSRVEQLLRKIQEAGTD